MSRKNFKVATAEDGKTTLVKIDKTPTGKVKTIKDKETIRKEREEQYKNFRVNALKRRAARMQMPQEQIDEAVKALLEQLDTPNSYTVLILFNPNDLGLIKEAMKNEGLVWKMISNSYLFMEADQETLKTIREIMPPSAKIHPYVKKKPSVLPDNKEKSGYIAKKTDKSTTAKARRNAKKAERYLKKIKDGMAHNDHKLHAELQKQKRLASRRKIAKRLKMMHKRFEKAALKASTAKAGTTVQLNPKKGSNARKKASTNLKKAA